MGETFANNRLAPEFFGPIPAWFLERIPRVDVQTERAEAVSRLWPFRKTQIAALGEDHRPLVLAEQIHGADIAILREDSPLPEGPIPGVDGLLTNRSDLLLGLLVADCAAVYLFDRGGTAVGLLHSGKKGTALGIVPAAIEAMQREWQIPPERLGLYLSPCIRPPHYEIDFPSTILHQAKNAGVTHCLDSQLCTASHPGRFYSYRRELGQTGRMLALIRRPD